MALTDMARKGIAGIVFLLVVLTVIGATATIVDNEADDITIDQRCGEAGCFYNATRGGAFTTECTVNNVTNDAVACTTAHTNTAFPLEALFNTSGIVILAFLGAGFILTITIGFRIWKSKQ